MSIEWGLPTVCDILKGAVILIKRPVKYAMSSKSFADGLQEEVGKLVEQVERVNTLAETARNNVRSFHRTFTTWEASAENALTEARNLLDAFDKARKTCCYGTLPDPYCRYQFSTKAEAKTEVIRELAQQCIVQFKELNDISFSSPALPNVTAVTPPRLEGKDVTKSTTATASVSSASMSIKLRDDDVFESRAHIIQDIKDALADNSNSVVGIHGMGGLGKSTLLEEVKRIISKEKSFDWVAKADVSKNPDIKMIQGEIADALGLSEIKDKESINGRAELLQRRLEKEESNKKRVLIILDNLWEGLDLNKVGIPCRHDNKVVGCKLLLTSRDRDVLRRNMGCDKDFLLGGLKEEEAKRLFERIVGAKVHDDEFKPLVNVALDKCAGVPFLIVAMAKRFKDANLSEWKDTLKKVEKFKDKEINDLMHQMLQWSYEKLEEEVKSLLRLCVVYGISKPSLENLVRYSVGLGIFQDVSSMEEARNRLNSHIRTLQASSLLLDCEDVDGFKIHDLVHDFIVAVSLRDYPLLVLKDEVKSVIELPKDKPSNYMAICFPHVDMEELPQKLDCPELRVFLLFTNNESLHVPYSLFNYMGKLMVLNLTGVHLTHSPLPFQLLENLHTLCLDGCSLGDVAILGKLKGLQILSFKNSNIQRLPKEIGQLVELRLLDLNYCSKLQIIKPGVLGSLIKLEELYMRCSFDQWNAGELPTPPTNASPVELNNMKKLCTLYVSFPNPSVLPKDLNVDKLIKYKITIGNALRDSIDKGLRILELNPTSDVLQKECIQSILGKTDDLFLDGYGGIEQSICALSKKGFPKLKHLQVNDSPSIHYIHQSSSHTNFKRLESLILKDLINVEKLCHNHIYYKSFSALKEVQVKSCHKMEVLFPLSSLRELPWLEEIKVSNCKSMRGIVEVDDCGNVELHNLRVLKLRDLPNIKNFFNTGSTPSSSMPNDQVGTQNAFFSGQQVAFPNLETLYITSLDNIEMIWDNQVVETIAENLLALTKLRISNCRILTEVINDEKGGDGRVVAFNQLKYMKLDGLIRLRSFSSGGYTLMFPLLEDIIVTRCPNMKFFFQGLMEASKLKRVQVSKEEWFWAGNLNITIQNMFEEMGTLAGVEKMLLSEFPGLIGKWHNELNPIKSYWQLKSMVVDKCPSFINAIPSRLMLVLDNLGYLQVRDCELLEEIFDLEGLEAVESTQVLPQLQELNLANLPKLRRLWNKDLQESICFDSLTTLILYNCGNLGHAFASSMTRCLANLYRMEIKECGQMEEVIVEEEGQGSTMEKITFSNLQWMKLECLLNLTCFLSRKNHMLECPQLEELIIAHCPKMESLIGQSRMEDDHDTPSFFTSQVQCPKLKWMALSHMDNLSKIWSDDPQETLTFDKFQKVQVQNCERLENVFPHWVATSLTQLKELQVESCKIEEIVASGNETPHSNTTRTLFPKLTSLVLHDMPQLKNFYTNLPTLNWPFLKELRVTHCDKVNMLSFVASTSNWTKKNYQQGLSNQEAHSSFETDFRNLERLLLVNNNIQMIQDRKFPKDIFGKLRALTLACFHDKEAAFPLKFLLERFPNLQILEVFCNYFEDIFPNEGLVDNGKHPVLEKLRELKLNELHSLKCVWREDSLVLKILQSIDKLEVWNCPCLTTVFPTVTSFQKLTSLKVKNCSRLVYLVTTSAITNLVNLKWMTIIGCERMKEIVANDGDREGKVITFGNLYKLTLQHLPSLECFSSIPSCTFKFPCLYYIEVEECPKMKTFSKDMLSTPRLYRWIGSIRLFRYQWAGDWEEGDDLNTTIQRLSA